MTRLKFSTDEEYQEFYGSMWESEKNRDEQSGQWQSMTPVEQEQSREFAIAEQKTEKKEKSTAVEKFKKYAYLESVQTTFKNLLGGNDKVARRFVESVVIAVAASPKLQECSARSIVIAAAQAASLGLSVDPNAQQAYLIPYDNEVKLIPDYRGLVQMVVNTNYYRYAPDVNEVYEGETAHKNRLTGEITIRGEKVSDTVIGWMAYSEAKNGIKRWLYMTNEECDKHGETYNPGGYHSKDSPWNNKKGANRGKMRRKTCLRTFVKRYGNFSPIQEQFFYSDEPVIDAGLISLPDPSIIPDPEPTPEKTHEERLEAIAEHQKVLGFMYAHKKRKG